MSGEIVNCAIPSLINGVSQQPAATRLSSQCDEQINAYSSVVDGLRKRPPLRHVAKILNTPIADAFVHAINRDMQEKYAVCILNGDIKAFDILNGGVEIPVNFPDGKTYLESALPRQDFSVVTVADHSFIVNKTIRTAMLPDRTQAEANEAIVYVKRGYVDTTYKVMVNDFWASHLTPSPSATVTSSTSGQDEAVPVNADDWTWTQCYNWLRSNNQPVPSEYDPWQWSDQQRGWFYSRSNGLEITNPGIYLIPELLDCPDSWLEEDAANMGLAKKWRDRAQESLTIKQSMRVVVYNASIAMIEQGVTTSVSTTTNTNTQPSTEKIAEALAASLQAKLDDFSITTLGSCIRIRRRDNQDFTFQVTDSWGEEALVGIKRETMKFNDLPAKCWDGVIVRITGENVGKDDDYYVVYNSDGSTKTGVWEETRGWDQEYAINPATMPHLLVREADGTFTFRQAEWAEAGAGDEDSIGNPSFIGQKISDVCFFRNRLGFISDESIVLSRLGDYYNFWPHTAMASLATDPIDYTVSHDKVSILRFAVPFGNSLLLFADQTQFQLHDGGNAALSPDTVKVDPTTTFECSPQCKPVGIGQNVYFVTERSGFSAVQEYFVVDDDVGNDAEEVTSNVSRYIPKNVYKMIASANEDMVALLSSDRRNEMWIYKFFWAGDDKLQSSWSRWVLPADDTILSVANIESDIFIVVQRPDGVYLDRIDLQSTEPDTRLGFQIHLDRRVVAEGVFNATANTTTWTLPYVDTQPLSIVLTGDFAGKGGMELGGVVQQGNTLTAPGDYSGGHCVIGRQYAKRYVFSTQFYKESRDIGAPQIERGRLQLRGFTVLHCDSGYFRSEVTSKGRNTVVAEHLGRVGDLNFRIGRAVIDSEPHRFGVLAKSDQVRIEIVNDRHYPSNLLSAEWTGTFTADVRRI